MKRGAVGLMVALSACGVPARHAHRVSAAPAPVAGRVAATDAGVAVAEPEPSVERAVLAAYYRARDIDTRAYLDLDSSQLPTAYAKDALDGRLDEIDRRRREARPMQIRMEFHPHVTMLGPAMAAVDDDVQNHSVRLDPLTKQPVEVDPNELLQDTFTLERLEGRWLVVLTARVTS